MADGIISSIGPALNFSHTIKVVDVGALPSGGTPYEPLLKAGYASVVGFEPNVAALAKLARIKGQHEVYLPYVVGDGKRHTLNYFNDGGMTSLFKPNTKLLELYTIFTNCNVVTRTEEVDTVRLDDIPEARLFDYLKIDVQGAELMVFENATEQLKNAVIIHTEVEFQPLYIGQPLFSDIDQFLRGQGFMLHGFQSLTTYAITPLAMHQNPYMGFGHILYADAIFIRDIVDLDPLSTDQLLKLAVILHDCYRSYDIALRLLTEYDRRMETNYSALYLNAITNARLPVPA